MSIWICPKCKKMMSCTVPGVCSTCGSSCMRVTDNSTATPCGQMAYRVSKKLGENIIGTPVTPYKRLSVELYNVVHEMGLDDHVYLSLLECEHKPDQVVVSTIVKLTLRFTEAPTESHVITIVLTPKDVVLHVGLEPELTASIPTITEPVMNNNGEVVWKHNEELIISNGNDNGGDE